MHEPQRGNLRQGHVGGEFTSRQLPQPLTVHLRGEGAPTGSGSDAGPSGTGVSSTSFYACSCTTGDPSGALAILLAALAAVAPRRRRHR